ncbi:uncharacterized protein LOC112501655 isoform X1 [Cynara cardunculus var. scolymus]|uniref:uncharacterized protein LOC112501655 isoform X1 n=1 Tax=Cynara cardunculus var. scolymus TaxID=59895 RepID=UPI000D62401F|nr:uncharacterized protein LOC112501655 isoform X1 [Cynara cardunculus var. scolymus]XP_024961126.1 uncharacterized protein LOC112501655 isoform X1 [Cynara cardunculus var. scolymus]
MGSTFNPQILVEKLAKLNNSQQSIETLSHWCIFHMNKAKQVVETWARQFHSSPRDQRLAFLYLANDILQNSRRKGSEFVGEFWKVLPDALRDVIDNGDEFGRNSALRLVNILDERKVFGSRGQVLKEELVGRHLETSNKNGKHSGLKLKRPAGDALDKIVSGYQVIYAGQVNEDAVMSKCRNAISCVEKVDKEIGGDIRSAKVNGPGVADELKGQHATLRDCIEQLTTVESSRTNLVSCLREALQEQEMKLGQVRSQLQAAHTQSEKADNFCRQLIKNPNGIQSPSEQGRKETHPSKVQSYVPGTGEQSAPVMYTRQIPFGEQSEEDTKSAAAAVAAKLTASTSSAEMLTYVLSSLASEGVIGNSRKESPSNDYPLQKRTKINNDQPPPYIPSSQNAQPPVPPFPHPDSLQHGNNSRGGGILKEPSHDQPPPPPPPSSPPPLPPMPPMQPYPVPPFMQSAGTVPYGHNTNQPPPPPPMPLPGFPSVGPPVNGVSSYTPALPPDGYQNYQIEGGFYSQQSAMPMAPMSRQ